jgi:serine/threonine protein kinase
MDQSKHGPLNVGDKFLGKYEVRGMLGRGGYAFVYECLDVFLGRSVALKIFKPVSGGPVDVERAAQKEARALLLISDERLVKLIDAGTHDGLVYLVMEKLNGRTLREVLQEVGRLTVPEALYIMLQVMRALAAAHRAGVIHRDIKPENIFIEADLSVKVLDLGIAKVQGLGAQTTHRDGLRGTVLYMAPEQLQGHGTTPRTDIYATGVVGFEMLVGHYLYLGEAPPTYEEVAWRQISFEPPMLDEIDAGIPHYVAKLIRRLILKAPEQRYETADHVIELLLGILNRLHDEWTPKGKFILRRLHEPLSLQGAPSPQDAARLVEAISRQVTVKAPQVPAGDTEPFSKQPFSDAGGARTAFSVSSPSSALSGGSTLASARRKEPSSSEKPTMWAVPRSALASETRSTSEPPRPVASAQTSTAPLKTSSPPVPAAGSSSSKHPAVASRDSSRAIPLPGTPPPVAAQVRPRAVVVAPPFLRDPVIRLTGIAAMVFGIVAGTGYGWLKFANGSPAATETADHSAQAVPTTDAAKASAPRLVPALPVVTAATTPAASGSQTALDITPAPRMSASPSPSPVAATPTPAATVRSHAKASAAAKTRDPLMPSDAEIKRRMQQLGSGLDPEPPTNPPAPGRAQPRASSSAIF